MPANPRSETSTLDPFPITTIGISVSTTAADDRGEVALGSGSTKIAAAPPIRSVVSGAMGNDVRTRGPKAVRRIFSARAKDVAHASRLPDPLHGGVAQHPHVAAPHRHHEVTCRDLAIEIVNDVATMRQVHHLGRTATPADAVHDQLARHARDRCLIRAVHVGHQDEVGIGDARAELTPERLNARVAMWLDQGDQPRGRAAASGGDRDRHLRGGVSVVVEEFGAPHRPAELEPAVHPAEARQRIGRGRAVHAEQIPDGRSRPPR